MTRNRFAKILTAAMLILTVTASSVVGVVASGDIIFSDEYDARTQSASKAIKGKKSTIPPSDLDWKGISFISGTY